MTNNIINNNDISVIGLLKIFIKSFNVFLSYLDLLSKKYYNFPMIVFSHLLNDK